jgi:hypothetical protein
VEGEVGETCLEVPQSVATVFSYPPLLLGYRIRFIGQCSYRIRDYLIRDPIWHIRNLLYITILIFTMARCRPDVTTCGRSRTVPRQVKIERLILIGAICCLFIQGIGYYLQIVVFKLPPHRFPYWFSMLGSLLITWLPVALSKRGYIWFSLLFLLFSMASGIGFIVLALN